MKYFPLLLLTFISISVFSQQRINLKDIKDHIGDSVTISAKIYGGKYLQSVKGAPTFLKAMVCPEAFIVEVVSVSVGMKIFSYQHFRFCVFTLNGCHPEKNGTSCSCCLFPVSGRRALGKVGIAFSFALMQKKQKI